jgi:predicted O-methyltransferase YrrM
MAERTGGSPARERRRGRRRRLAMGLATLFGRERGFFIPHRYAGSVQPCAYPALESLLAACTPAFRSVLDDIETHAERLQCLGEPAPEPRFDQAWFPTLDAAAAYAMVRRVRPTRIVEVGSGHSTRFLARAIADAGLATELVCIDPAPRAPLRGLRVRWIESIVQQAPEIRFSALQAGDVLFIDSSHILMPGSDVDILFNHILPTLPAGSVVHIHDIFLPDDYPPEWDWRGYNEQLGVIPMLLGGGWTPLFASRYVETRMTAPLAATLVARLPNPEAAPNTSLWLRKG